ncbi:hypothetical protein Q31b_06540 [Novipirellula aureliae]|uniref:Uncharacterized protein n=1 Tax=Novipirellula aureliae TaxID=2527966 RepID=A0A5C6E947_9BACT|nr:hypothetical protein [Novipirellula aureliae]TWU45482.1 hypothetical protein Q31b_06540 [Novipirellula aureliae]
MKNLIAVVICTALVATTGCQPPESDVAPGPLSEADHDHDHDHPSHGPNGGTLIELGDEEYHAELVHDDVSVTIYLLDSAAAEPVRIAEQELVINVLHDGAPEQFKLLANPDAGDTDGKSSRFTIEDDHLASHMDDDAAAPKLSVTIDGTPYSGEISHHDHEH